MSPHRHLLPHTRAPPPSVPGHGGPPQPLLMACTGWGWGGLEVVGADHEY